jgi:hypothetical protein
VKAEVWLLGVGNVRGSVAPWVDVRANSLAYLCPALETTGRAAALATLLSALAMRECV